MSREWSAAEQLRDAGMAQAENAADPRVIATIDKVIADLNATGLPWSANAVRQRVAVTSRGLVGARIRAAAMRRPVEQVRVGFEPSTLPSTRTAHVAIWRGVAVSERRAS